MKTFLEKDLEEIIYNADREKLSDNGLKFDIKYGFFIKNEGF